MKDAEIVFCIYSFWSVSGELLYQMIDVITAAGGEPQETDESMEVSLDTLLKTPSSHKPKRTHLDMNALSSHGELMESVTHNDPPTPSKRAITQKQMKSTTPNKPGVEVSSLEPGKAVKPSKREIRRRQRNRVVAESACVTQSSSTKESSKKHKQKSGKLSEGNSDAETERYGPLANDVTGKSRIGEGKILQRAGDDNVKIILSSDEADIPVKPKRKPDRKTAEEMRESNTLVTNSSDEVNKAEKRIRSRRKSNKDNKIAGTDSETGEVIGVSLSDELTPTRLQRKRKSDTMTEALAKCGYNTGDDKTPKRLESATKKRKRLKAPAKHIDEDVTGDQSTSSPVAVGRSPLGLSGIGTVDQSPATSVNIDQSLHNGATIKQSDPAITDQSPSIGQPPALDRSSFLELQNSAGEVKTNCRRRRSRPTPEGPIATETRVPESVRRRRKESTPGDENKAEVAPLSPSPLDESLPVSVVNLFDGSSSSRVKSKEGGLVANIPSKR